MSDAMMDWRKISLRAEGLASLRGFRLLFRDLDLEAASGSFTVLRGPNGSGKTTLLRILAGLMPPSMGEIGWDNTPDEAIHLIGHASALKPFETPRTATDGFIRLSGLKRKPALTDALLDRVGLGRPADVPVRFLSAGQKKRTLLARLLAVPRPVWLLDEPFANLDAAGRELVERLISEQCAKGGIVIAASHDETGLAPDVILDLAEARTVAS
jgi:heme exporter protein A